jgi:hypothetical protein
VHFRIGVFRDLEGAGCADGWRGWLLVVASKVGLVVGASLGERVFASRVGGRRVALSRIVGDVLEGHHEGW